MTARRLVTIPANEVEFRRPRFLLEGRIPFGAVTIVAGEPDAGKTTLLALLGAQTTRGTIAGDLADPASVLFVSTEDSPAFTLGPRVAAAGADLARIHFLQHVLDGEVEDGLVLPRDLQALEQTIVDQGVWLVVLDPISATIDGKLDTHRDQHVRIVLGRLAALAERQNIAVVAIMHYKKGTESTALNQIGGSVAFGAAARSVLLFGADPDDESDKRRLLVHIKCNVGPKQRTLAFHRVTRVIEGANELVEAPFLQADGESEVTGAELLSKDDEPAARREAREFWLAELADGPVATVELKRRAEAAGLAWRTLERVVRNLGVQSRKVGETWQRSLATMPSATARKDDIVGTVGTVETGKDAKSDNNDVNTALEEQASLPLDDDEDLRWLEIDGARGDPYADALNAQKCGCDSSIVDEDGDCTLCGRSAR